MAHKKTPEPARGHKTPVRRCQLHGKIMMSKAEAKNAAARMQSRQINRVKTRVYRAECGSWHVTKMKLARPKKGDTSEHAGRAASGRDVRSGGV